MSSLGGRRLERGVDGERLAELLLARALAVGGAMDEGEVLVRPYPLGVGKALGKGLVQVARGGVVAALLVQAHPGGERRLALARRDGALGGLQARLGFRPGGLAARFSFHRAEHRSPRWMAGFGGGELQPGVEVERAAELVAALALAVGGAVHEGEVLVRPGAVPVGQAALDRALQGRRGLLVLAFLVKAQPGAERRLAALHRAEDRPPHRMPGLGGGEFHLRLDGERLAEILAAQALAARGAVHEGKVLVRARTLDRKSVV